MSRTSRPTAATPSGRGPAPGRRRDARRDPHELRGPLNAILGWTQLLEPRQDLPSDVRDALKVIRRNAVRQRQILDEIANVGRLLAGGLEVERRPMRLADAVEEACRGAHSYLAAKGVTLACDGAGPDLVCVR